MTCKSCQTMFVDFQEKLLSNEQNAQMDAHLRSCDACQQAWQEYQYTIRTMIRRERFEPDESYWNGYWDRLEEKLPSENIRHRSQIKLWQVILNWMSVIPRWGYQLAGAAALLIIGFIVGLQFRTIENTTIEIPANPIQSQLTVAAQTNRYLERSKTLLLGIVNLDPEQEQLALSSVRHQRRISRELVDEARYLKTALNQPGQQRLQELVSELELILMQITNLDAQYDLQSVDLIQQSIDQQGIFLKIDLEEMKQQMNRDDARQQAHPTI
ncbi:zf-HC2 domain-containing protein [candidate division KSB1 bacterium]|nr:zf-HC2 domain-containing protein [candidate division KSB1 bacterium]